MGLESNDLVVFVLLPHPPFQTLIIDEFVELQEISDGFYNLQLPNSASLEVGNYMLLINSTETPTPAFEPLEIPYSVVPKPVNASIPSNLCIVHGNIKDIAGRDMAGGVPIIFRNVDFPGIQGTSLISTNKFETNTDAFGNFTAPLIRGRKVNMEVQAAGFKVQFVVPDAETAAVTDLFPT